ncbi:response regulator [Geomesophilobacter sediminis]|uniref:Response regulator n=1 Tax=Geomesophilobacter sediminis TaxID=2798584 RepID=A0A8J7M2S3_9BACT|nr:response regulator [Geomesophilobacter sediminis]MBJ6727366.1 response regulator [Geomesophilobacter sediminis]
MKKRCLIVDDDQFSRELMSRLLEPHFDCRTAVTGEHAWELIDANWHRGEPFQLICCELAMPGLNGHRLIRKVRELEASVPVAGNRRSRIFVVSASNSPWDRAETVLDGIAEGYIVKPCHPAQLRELLIENGLVEH